MSSAVVAAVCVVPVGSVPAVAECVSAAATTAAAVRAAQVCGGRVEDLSGRSATAQVFANADGTMTAEESAQPRFVEVDQPADPRDPRSVPTRSWQPVDMTLVAKADGTVGPVSSPLGVALSGGGSAPLMKVQHAGSEPVSLSWPSALPTPVLAGSTATYADVVPGVDLRVQAGVDGVGEVLVVKSPAAAAQLTPSITTSISAPGMTVAVDATHGLQVKHGSDVLLSGGVPVMWDSTAAPAGGRSAEVASSSPSGPGSAAKVAAMPTALADGTLSVTPDAKMLTSPDTRYPVYIDPTVSKASWTMINGRAKSQSYWSFDKTDCGDGVWKGKGLQCAKVGYTDETTVNVYRSLFAFSTGSFAGKHVQSATFSIDELHSWSCSKSSTDLYVVNDVINSGTNWSNDEGKWGGSVASVSNQDCDDSRIYTGFTAGALISAVDAASGSQITLGLGARNESTTDDWKKFDAGTAKLDVTYNSYPNTPGTLTIDGKACGTGDGKARVSTVGGHNPVLKARLSDPDSGDHLVGRFSWSTKSGTATGSQGNIANGQYAQVATSAASFDSGVTYSFSVSASDGTDGSKGSAGPCEFTVDNSQPDAEPTVISGDGRYGLPQCDGTNGWCDGVGKTGSFTFGANGVSDVAGFLYGFTSPPATRVNTATAGGNATVQLTPTSEGLSDLFVRSVDQAGNLGPIRDYRFFVGTGTNPVAIWKLDDGSGAAASDTGIGTGSPAVQHPATLSDVAWTTNTARIVGGTAATFNGTTSEGRTDLVVDTTKSFTVSAWARVTDTSVDRTIVALDSTGYASLYFQYQHYTNTWLAQMPSAMSGSSITWWSARSTTTPKIGVWTHLGAAYDAGTHRLSLYVNGVEEAAVSGVTPYSNPNEVTTVGRSLGTRFAGDLSDVRIWDRYVPVSEMHDVTAPIQVASWKFNDGSGNQAADSTLFNHPGTLSDGAAWTPTGHTANDRGAITFNGIDAVVSSNAMIHTNQSFTVAAWVRLTGTNWFATAVSQDGAHSSGFQLQYGYNCKCWEFALPNADGTSPGQVSVLSSTPVQLNTWTHLAATYDATTNTATLYVNGVAAPSQQGPAAPWDATGAFTVGRTWWNDTTNDWFPGDIDAVNVYQGALGPTAIQALANS